ncbi:MAG: hypothetical protein LAN71_08390 [Acidobacteriia bacterium]|nr:hypothetical protein [Terriglobia bacterium]
MAVAVTAFLFARAIRGPLHPARTEFERLLQLDGLLHGWVAMAINIAFYASLCGGALKCIYDAGGRERLFMVGLFAKFLLFPLGILGSYWVETIGHIGMLGSAVALLAALSLLLRPSNAIDSGS